jgi:hypothetical protein
VTAVLISGVVAAAGAEVIGVEYLDADGNRRAVGAADLAIVGIALRAPHREADAVLRGLSRHP